MSFLGETKTFYDVLEIKPNCSSQEIRDSYFRLKKTFQEYGIALYTVFTAEEQRETLEKIEEAFKILSDPKARFLYDQSIGLASASTPMRHSKNLDGVSPGLPPMENLLNAESLLVSPTTEPETYPESFLKTPPPFPPPPIFSTRPPNTSPHRTPSNISPSSLLHDRQLALSIDTEQEWSGAFLRRVRETQNLSLEEVSAITKVTKSYIQAIEEEKFGRLPAPVYIRSFIVQISKALKLPHEKVASAYLKRYSSQR